MWLWDVCLFASLKQSYCMYFAWQIQPAIRQRVLLASDKPFSCLVMVSVYRCSTPSMNIDHSLRVPTGPSLLHALRSVGSWLLWYLSKLCSSSFSKESRVGAPSESFEECHIANTPSHPRDGSEFLVLQWLELFYSGNATESQTELAYMTADLQTVMRYAINQRYDTDWELGVLSKHGVQVTSKFGGLLNLQVCILIVTLN